MRPPSAGRAIPRTARGWENARRGRGRRICGHGPQDDFRAERGQTFLCAPKGADVTPSKRGASQPPILFSAAQPPRPFWAAPTSVGVRRREPGCGATVVYSIKKGPHCAVRSGGTKRTGRWSGPRENAPGGQSRHFCGNAVRHRIAGRARFDGGTMFPRKPLLFGRGILAG